MTALCRTQIDFAYFDPYIPKHMPIFLIMFSQLSFLRYDSDHNGIRPLSFHYFPPPDPLHMNLVESASLSCPSTHFRPKIRFMISNRIITPSLSKTSLRQESGDATFLSDATQDRTESLYGREFSSGNISSNNDECSWNLVGCSFTTAFHYSDDQLAFLSLQLRAPSSNSVMIDGPVSSLPLLSSSSLPEPIASSIFSPDITTAFGSHQFLLPEEFDIQSDPWYISIRVDLKQHTLVDFCFLNDPQYMPISYLSSPVISSAPSAFNTTPKNAVLILLVNPCPVSESTLGWSLGQTSALVLSVDTMERSFRLIHKISPLPSNAYSIRPLWLPSSNCLDTMEVEALPTGSTANHQLPPDRQMNIEPLFNESHQMKDENDEPKLLSPHLLILSPHSIGCVKALQSTDMSIEECLNLCRKSTAQNSLESPQLNAVTSFLNRRDSVDFSSFQEAAPTDRSQSSVKLPIEDLKSRPRGDTADIISNGLDSIGREDYPSIREFYQVIHHRTLLGPRVSELMSMVCGGAKIDPIQLADRVPLEVSSKIKGLLFLKRPVVDSSHLELTLTEYEWLYVDSLCHILIPRQYPGHPAIMATLVCQHLVSDVTFHL